MSDFLFVTEPRPEGSLANCLARYLSPVAARVDEVHGPGWTLAWSRRPEAPSPVCQDARGVTVVVGEPLAAPPGEAAARLHLGSRRAAVHRLALEGAAAWETLLDGVWAALVIPARGSPRVVTDRFGFVPVYRTELPAGGFAAGTHVDAVARAANREREVDPVSLADLLIHLTCTFPYTPYREVRQLAPGTETDLRAGTGAPYWLPDETDRFRTLPTAAEALREGIRADLRAACVDADRAGMLLSGGEDSRALLGAMPSGVPVFAYTYSGSMNREARAARRSARAYGAGFMFGRREDDHYETGMEVVAGMVGSSHLFMDVHGYRLHWQLGLNGLPVVIGGLSADSLLKANYAPARDAGAPPPPLPAAPGIRPALVAAVAERRAAFLAWLREIRPRTALEWSVLYPFSMRKHGANVHGNRRLFAAHESYHCNVALDVAAAAPVEWKRNRRLFVTAMRPYLRRSWHVPHARSRFPYFGAGPNLVLGALLRGGRVAKDLVTGQFASRQGGWPRWGDVAGSTATAAAWTRFPPEDSALREVFQPGPPALAAITSVHPLRQMMALQLSTLLRDDAR